MKIEDNNAIYFRFISTGTPMAAKVRGVQRQHAKGEVVFPLYHDPLTVQASGDSSTPLRRQG
jgi:hypothetical protein